MHLATSDALLRHKCSLLARRSDQSHAAAPGPGEKRCNCCHHIYPDTGEFFFCQYVRADGSRLLSPRCRACAVEKKTLYRRQPPPTPSATRELHRILHLFSLPMSNAQSMTAHTWSVDGEDFPYSSLSELLEANPGIQPGAEVYYGIPVPPSPADFVSAKRVLQDVQTDAAAAYGDCAQGYAQTATPEALADLQAMLEAWLMEHIGLPDCYSVSNVCTYSVTKEDLQ